MADYYISGVWFTTIGTHKYVSHVMIHNQVNNNLQKGVKTSKDDAIRLIKQGKTIATMQWDYNKPFFVFRADVGYETLNGTEYLRTIKNNTKIDNLDKELNMSYLF